MIFDDVQPGEDNDADEEMAALEQTRRVVRDRWFRRFIANELRHHAADAWALKADARSISPRCGLAPLSRLP